MTSMSKSPSRRIRLQHLDLAFGVKTRSRLIEKNQVGIVDNRLCQLHALLHTSGEIAEVAESLLFESHQEQRL